MRGLQPLRLLEDNSLVSNSFIAIPQNSSPLFLELKIFLSSPMMSLRIPRIFKSLISKDNKHVLRMKLTWNLKSKHTTNLRRIKKPLRTE